MLPANRVRAPFEIMWPAVVGFDHVWRHAVLGTRLAAERPAADHTESRRRLSAASALI